jgi:hypothetical protein
MRDVGGIGVSPFHLGFEMPQANCSKFMQSLKGG